MESVENTEVGEYRVYLVTNLINGKQYAGQTRTGVEVRWKRHCNKSVYRKNALAKAIRKHGSESFVVAVVKYGLTKQEADTEERLLIRYLDLMTPSKGYNLTEGGEGGRQADSVREKMGWHLKGRGAFWLDGPDREAIMEQILVSRGMKKDPLCGDNFYESELPTASVIEEYENGASSNELASKYGCSAGTILRRLKDSGTQIRDAKAVSKMLGEKSGWSFLKNLPRRTGWTHSEGTKQKITEASTQRRRDVDDSEVVRLYNEGKSTIQIAEIFSMTANGIRYRLKINGVERRGVGCRNGRVGPTQK